MESEGVAQCDGLVDGAQLDDGRGPLVTARPHTHPGQGGAGPGERDSETPVPALTLGSD